MFYHLIFYQRLLCAVLTTTIFLLFHINGPAQSADRSKTLEEIASLRKQLSEKEKLLLLPSTEDLAIYAEFLKQPNTGLIRLLPRKLFGNRLTISGGGASYSFSRLSHESGYGYDIHLNSENNYYDSEYVAPTIEDYIFAVGASGNNYGYMTALGNVPLEKVTLDHDAVKFLLAYNPPSSIKDVRAEQQRVLKRGMVKNGHLSKTEAPATPNFTYVLRSINFGFSDVIIAFRYVRTEKDGGVVILWKMLKQLPKPELLRPETRRS